MPLHDSINGTKAFKKGMVAGAKPFEAKFEQVAGAVDRLANLNEQQWQEMKGVADVILNRMEASDKAEVYGLNTQFDIKVQLRSEYKELLVAILYTLGGENSSEFQQSYIRSVQKYLEITLAQTNIDFAAIEKIDSLDSQKAILQACMEYLLLANGNPAFFEKYEENLFAHFSVKETDALSLWDNVLRIYTATGPLGLAEKYGFAPEAPKESEADTEAEIRLEQLVIKDVLNIPADEQKTYCKKEIVVEADIDCAGNLVFENCVIKYDLSKLSGKIQITDKGSVSFVSCTVLDLTTEYEPHQSSFITQKSPCRLPSVFCKNSLFLDCQCFFSSYGKLKIKLDNCIIRYTKKLVSGGSFISGQGIEMESEVNNCLFESTTDSINHGIYPILYDIEVIKNCTFKNLGDVIFIAKTVENCLFENCSNVVHRVPSIISCRFIGCSFCVDKNYSVKCMTIKGSQFFNTKSSGISLSVEDEEKPRNTSMVIDCLFDGFDLQGNNINPYLICCPSVGTGWDKYYPIVVENCFFKHCVTSKDKSLIQSRVTHEGIFRNKYVDTIKISNCQGLENTNREGSSTNDLPETNETKQGEPIGARLAGVYGAGQEKVTVKEGSV